MLVISAIAMLKTLLLQLERFFFDFFLFFN